MIQDIERGQRPLYRNREIFGDAGGSSLFGGSLVQGRL